MTQLRPLALAVLELLHEAPMHPYEIRQKMRERQVGRLTKVTTGSLYHAVEKLAEDDLIVVVDTSRDGRRPERTTYRLTAAGRDAFLDHTRTMVTELATEYPRFVMAVAFLHTLQPDEALEALRRRVVELRAKVSSEQNVFDELVAKKIDPLFWLEVDFRGATYRAELAWVEELITRIASGDLPWPAKVLRRQAELNEEYE